MKIAVLFSLARQVEGEYVFANVLKTHVDPTVLREYLNSSDLPKTSVVAGVECVVEYGVFTDVEVEGVE